VFFDQPRRWRCPMRGLLRRSIGSVIQLWAARLRQPRVARAALSRLFTIALKEGVGRPSATWRSRLSLATWGSARNAPRRTLLPPREAVVGSRLGLSSCT
jgi:hypothetical protein